MSTVNYQAAIRKLEATLIRQQAAVEATNAQIELFRKMIVDENQRQLELVVKGGTQAKAR